MANAIRKSQSAGKAAARRSEPDVRETIRRIERGFKYAEFEKLQKRLGLSQEQMAKAVGINPRTLTRRKNAGRLTSEESERVLRICRLFDLATELFAGKQDAAADWLTTPKMALADRSPLDFADTEIGAREVESFIGRIRYGVIQ
jgi:putative toxin-antitoxin system antitoxin component (TIGR02293 family)